MKIPSLHMFPGIGWLSFSMLNFGGVTDLTMAIHVGIFPMQIQCVHI